MKHLAHVMLVFFWHFGGVGLLVLGILDSSFLFAPLGNDLLVVAASARTHSVPLMFYYAGMSSAGSVLGCLLVDVVFRHAGEHELEKYLSRRRMDAFRRKITEHAAWALVLASIAPPPFPFTLFVMASSALQYPRKKLLTLVGAARMARFTALGTLALIFGARILRIAQNSVVQGFLIGLIVVCIVGSVVSVVGWIRRSRRQSSRGAHEPGLSPRPL